MIPRDGIRFERAIDLVDGAARLSTGCRALDDVLRGGLPAAGIVEIAGESGCGKSQLCKQLTLTVQYPASRGGLNGGAVYICTEERFQSKRLYQLIEKFPAAAQLGDNIDFGDNILVVHVGDFDNLEECLRKVPGVIRSKNVKLLVVDSITAVFRGGNYAPSEGSKKVKEVRAIGSILHKLSYEHELLVVCVNQMAQSVSDGEMVPALGLSWANLVTTRLLMSRRGDARMFQVLYSPELPSNVVTQFSIRDCGITNAT